MHYIRLTISLGRKRRIEIEEDTVMHENAFNKSDLMSLLQIPNSLSHEGGPVLRRGRKL